MALFIPPIDPATMEHGSEADIARALLKCLPAGYIVMHSLPWVNPARDELDAPAREGEADFLILHRQHGLLILEVKGGEITLKGRLWYRQVRSDLKPIKDPVRQARRSLWALKSRIAHVCGKAIADQTVISVAIAFPHGLFKEQPPPDLPRDAIITIEDLATIDVAVLRAYRAGGGSPKEMTVKDFEAVRRAIAPEFRVYEPLRLTVDMNAELLARLTRQQLQVLRGFDANPRAIIEGVAGSGKTLLAMQRARSFASSYPAVLLTCFNAELAKWMREQLGQDTIEKGGRVTVLNFHGLAAELCRRAGINFSVNSNDPGRWWDEIAPDLLAQAALDLYGGEQVYGAIVVDEAQDFSPSWWDALDYVWDNNGPVWAFLDKAQSLRREPVEPPIKGAFYFALDVNCRNTRRIVAYANTAANVVSQSFELAPLGRPPKMIVPSNPAAISGVVQAEVRALLKDHRLEPRQIAILGPASKSKGPLSNITTIDTVPLVEDAGLWREGKGVLCSTARSFKGLEADVVILYDFSGIGHLFTVSDLYVALTRARSFLIVVAHDRSAKERLEAALAAAISTGSEE
jgi:hypothetical protein